MTWEADNPDLTSCFQETILVWVPCAFLWIASPYELYRIKNTILKTRSRIPFTLVSILKLVSELFSWFNHLCWPLFLQLFCVTLSVFSSLELIESIVRLATSKNKVYPVEYYTPFIKLLTFCLASILISLNRKKAINSSGILWLFWFIFSIGSVVTYRSIFISILDDVSTVAW